MEPSSSKHVKEMLKAEIGALLADTGGVKSGVDGGGVGSAATLLGPEREADIISQCRTTMTCCPLYVALLARHIAR